MHINVYVLQSVQGFETKRERSASQGDLASLLLLVDAFFLLTLALRSFRKVAARAKIPFFGS
jgi:hypothetical protein